MKCPSCGRTFNQVNLVRGPLGNQLSGPLIAGFTATYPSMTCQTVLGVLPDPDNIAHAVMNRLKAGK
jgi:hypothetical protein